MELITIGTGSAGNCYLLHRNNGHYIALDCGMPWKSVMIGCDFMPSLIDFALYTHEHRDHSKYIMAFVRNCVTVYGPDTSDPGKAIHRDGVTVVPFEVPHDVKCYGYLIQVDGEKLIYMTDFGYCRYTFKSYKVEHWLIACNHIDAPVITEEKYAHVVTGHSSLSTVKDLLSANKTDKMRNVIICHYSADADTDRMETEIRKTLGDGVNVSVARKGTTICLSN